MPRTAAQDQDAIADRAGPPVVEACFAVEVDAAQHGADALNDGDHELAEHQVMLQQGNADVRGGCGAVAFVIKAAKALQCQRPDRPARRGLRVRLTR